MSFCQSNNCLVRSLFSLCLVLPIVAATEAQGADVEAIKIELESDGDGQLVAIILDGRELTEPAKGAGKNLFDTLHDDVVKLTEAAKDGAPPRQVDLKCDRNLHYEYIVQALTAVSLDLEEGKASKRVGKIVIEFNDTIADSLVIDVTKEGKVVIEGATVEIGPPLELALNRFRRTLARQGGSPASVLVTIRSHEGVATGKVQDIIRICQNSQFQKFRLRAIAK